MGIPGMRKRRAQSPDADRARMWKAMRMMLQFTSADVEATSEVSTGHARKFIKALQEAGYLRCVAPRASGIVGGHAVWRLIKNTGPVPPRFSKDGVYDANVEEPVPRPEDRPLLRCAPALLLQLHRMVDLQERLQARKTVTSDEIDRVMRESRALIAKAEDRT